MVFPFHSFTEDEHWPLSWEDMDVHIHINLPFLTSFLVVNLSFLIFGIFGDDSNLVLERSLADIFWHLHWASKSILRSLLSGFILRNAEHTLSALIRRCR